MNWFSKIHELAGQEYERYLPTAFDSSLTLLEKVNKVIETLNQIVLGVNTVADYVDEHVNTQNEKIRQLRDDFEILKDWLENEGLEERTGWVLNEWFDSGKLAQIINNDVFDMKADKATFEQFVLSITAELQQTEQDLTTQLQQTEQEINAQLVDNGVSITKNGATRGQSDSLTAINTTINESSNVIIPEGEFTIDNQLYISDPVTLTGKTGQSLTQTNTSVPGDINIQSDDVTFDNFNFIGKSTVQGVYTGSVKRFRILKSKITSDKHGVHINTPNVEDVEIIGSDINASSFGVLTNENAKNSRNLTIAFSKIYSSTADAIELNNPSDLTTDTWKQAKVIGNTITADENGIGSGSGFAIGVAKTRDVVIMGNTITKSRNEALHIEDDQENVIVEGNVFNGCLADGARILKGGHSGTGEAKPIVVVNNHFVKEGLTKTGTGIWRTYDALGSLDSNFSGNCIRGFDIGLLMDGRASSNVNGCIIEDCNVAIKTGERSVISGSVIAMNCPTLVQGASGSTIDKIVSKIKPTTVLEYVGTAGNAGSTLKGFSIENKITTLNAESNTINLFSLPTIMMGKLTLKNSDSHKLWFTCDLSWDGTTLTVTNLMKKTGGVLGSTIAVINNNGQLAFTVYSGSSITTTIVYDFDGVYYQE